MTTFGTKNTINCPLKWSSLSVSNRLGFEFLVLFGCPRRLQLLSDLLETSSAVESESAEEAERQERETDQNDGNDEPDGEAALIGTIRVVLAGLIQVLHERVGQLRHLLGLLCGTLVFGEANPTVPEFPSAATLDPSRPLRVGVNALEIRPTLLLGLLVAEREVFVD